MDPSRLLRTPIVVEAVSTDVTRDDMGDPAEVSTFHVFRGWLWQVGATEQDANAAVGSESWQLALEAAAAPILATGSRIYVDAEVVQGDYVPGTGRRFSVDGPPYAARHPRTMQVVYVQAREVRSD